METEHFDIVGGALQVNTLIPYLLSIFLDYELETSIDLMKENGFKLAKERTRRYPTQTVTETDYKDDIAFLANTAAQAETLQYNLEQTAGSISFFVNADNTK